MGYRLVYWVPVLAMALAALTFPSYSATCGEKVKAARKLSALSDSYIGGLGQARDCSPQYLKLLTLRYGTLEKYQISTDELAKACPSDIHLSPNQLKAARLANAKILDSIILKKRLCAAQ
jgi:hypothetical protein